MYVVGDKVECLTQVDIDIPLESKVNPFSIDAYLPELSKTTYWLNSDLSVGVVVWGVE